MTILRDVQDQDMASLTDLWVRSWQSVGLDIDFEARRGWLFQHLAALKAAGTRIIGAFDEGRLKGFVTIHPLTGRLDQLAVHPDAFGSGLAHMLMNAARDHAPGFIVLDVNEANPRAVRFYEREGFMRIGSGISPLSGLRTLALRWQA